MNNRIVEAYARLPRNLKYSTALKMIAEATGKTEKQVDAAVTRFINKELKELGITSI